MTNAPTPARLHLMVAQDLELPPLVQALSRAALVVGMEAGQTWTLNYTVGPPSAPPPKPTDLAVVSMLHEMLPPFAPIQEVAARWRERLQRLSEAGAPALLCNVFRHVGPQPLGKEFPPPAALRERALRLNLLAVELSHRYGADVADIDARLAVIGARMLQSDFRLGGWGAAAASDAIAWSLLQGELQALLPGNVGARSVARHGGVAGIIARLQEAVAGRMTPTALDRSLKRPV